MTKHCAQNLILIIVVAATAAIALPQAALPDQTVDEASGREKFKYTVLRYSEKDFDSKGEFEEWLDNLGAKGWVTIWHFGGVDQRLFMRSVKGPKLVVDYEIARQKISPATDNFKKWVPAFDKLGKKGRFVVDLFKDDGKWHSVREIRTLEGVLQTVSWEDEPAGTNQPREPEKFMKAVEKLAEKAHVSRDIGISKGQVSSIGIGETTPGRVNTVEVRFGEASSTTPLQKWKKMINEEAKNGYIVSDAQLSDPTGNNFTVVFAQVKVNGKFERRKCVLEPIRANHLFNMAKLEKLVKNMNKKGKKGYEMVWAFSAQRFTSLQFVLCKDK